MHIVMNSCRFVIPRKCMQCAIEWNFGSPFSLLFSLGMIYQCWTLNKCWMSRVCIYFVIQLKLDDERVENFERRTPRQHIAMHVNNRAVFIVLIIKTQSSRKLSKLKFRSISKLSFDFAAIGKNLLESAIKIHFSSTIILCAFCNREDFWRAFNDTRFTCGPVQRRFVAASKIAGQLAATSWL